MTAAAAGRRRRLFALLVVLAACASGCGGESGTAPGAVPMALVGVSSNTSDAAFALPTFGDSVLRVLQDAKAAGADVQIRAPQWDRVEPTPGTWQLAEEQLYLDVHRSLGLRTHLNLRILDTISRNLPADLASLAWDDPVLVARVDVLVDTLAALARRSDLVSVAIGNEVDAYFGEHPGEFPAFLALYRREVARFHAAAPGVPMGISTTNPLANPLAHYGDSLNVTSDIVLHTFYDTQPGGFTQKPAPAFDADLEAVVARAHGKPVAFQEVGYASSPVVGGSPEAQAEAARRFRAWLGRQPRSRVLYASWFLYTDWSSVSLNSLFGYYGFQTPEFAAFLGSLGLRDSLGRAKPAWETFRTGR